MDIRASAARGLRTDRDWENTAAAARPTLARVLRITLARMRAEMHACLAVKTHYGFSRA